MILAVYEAASSILRTADSKSGSRRAYDFAQRDHALWTSAPMPPAKLASRATTITAKAPSPKS